MLFFVKVRPTTEFAVDRLNFCFNYLFAGAHKSALDLLMLRRNQSKYREYFSLILKSKLK